MSQIKDTARWVPTGPSRTLRQTGPIAIDGQISGLLTRRNRLLEELASVDAKLADLRSAAAGGGAATTARWLPLRGEQLRKGAFAVPPELDRDDLDRRLAGILVDERRSGLALDGLEILVSFRSDEGRVLSVKTRRTGEAEWIRRFEAVTPGPGH